jgi:hypothetical protein
VPFRDQTILDTYGRLLKVSKRKKFDNWDAAAELLKNANDSTE